MEELVTAISELNEDKVYKIVHHHLENKVDPIDIITVLEKGMEKVGEYYEKNEYFITDLIMAGILFKEVLEIEEIKVAIHTKEMNKGIGRMVLGTVAGDIHDIGKNLFKELAINSGIEVIDLGVDVESQVFCDKVREYQPDIIGLSGVLTMSLGSIKKTIDALVVDNLRDDVKIIVGGTIINQGTSYDIGADEYTNDAYRGIKICKQWVEDLQGNREK